MAVRADFPVVLDADVLAEATVSDLFLRLSEEPRLLLPRWTERLWAEVDRTCIEKLGWDPKVVQERREAATSFFPDAMISGFEELEDKLTNDEKDRHVLAAAIHGKVDTIITFNLRHFLPAALEHWGVVAKHPGSYLETLYEHDSAVVIYKLEQIAKARKRPLDDVLGRLAWSVPSFSAFVAKALQLDVPQITPQNWSRE